MPSLFSWIINANPKRKKDRWRFLSWGHSVLHAETSTLISSRKFCPFVWTLHSKTALVQKWCNTYRALMDCNFENFLPNIVQELGSLRYRILQRHILEPQIKIWPLSSLWIFNTLRISAKLQGRTWCIKIKDLSIPVAGCTILAAAPNARFFWSVFGKDPPTGM